MTSQQFNAAVYEKIRVKIKELFDLYMEKPYIDKRQNNIWRPGYTVTPIERGYGAMVTYRHIGHTENFPAIRKTRHHQYMDILEEAGFRVEEVERDDGSRYVEVLLPQDKEGEVQ